MKSIALPKIPRRRRASQSSVAFQGKTRVTTRIMTVKLGFIRQRPGPGLVWHKSVCYISREIPNIQANTKERGVVGGWGDTTRVTICWL